MNRNLTLRDSIPFILDCLEVYGYSVEYMNTFRRHMNCVVDYYNAEEITYYASGQYEQFLSHVEREYASGNLSPELFRSYRKCAYFLDEYSRLGAVAPRMLVQGERKVLIGIFKELLDSYLTSLTSLIRESTIGQRRFAIQKYLYHFQSFGYESIDCINVSDVQRYFTCLSVEISKRTLNQNRLHIRQFHVYLHETGKFSPNWLSFFDFKALAPRKIQGYLTTEEIDSILSQIKTETSVGKRDFAIVSLARTTGFRGCDIINLKLTDIDWKLGIISVCQQKTGISIQLPLLTESGEALKDYILNGRPRTECHEVFVRALAPYTALRSTSSLDDLIRKYQKSANHQQFPWDGKAFHGTRRGLGRNLVLAGVPVTSIMQILGHGHMDSSKPYMMLNTPELKECSLDFTSIPVERGEFL
jgi:Site-specific recombinase XerD